MHLDLGIYTRVLSGPQAALAAVMLIAAYQFGRMTVRWMRCRTLPIAPVVLVGLAALVAGAGFAVLTVRSSVDGVIVLAALFVGQAFGALVEQLFDWRRA